MKSIHLECFGENVLKSDFRQKAFVVLVSFLKNLYKTVDLDRLVIVVNLGVIDLIFSETALDNLKVFETVEKLSFLLAPQHWMTVGIWDFSVFNRGIHPIVSICT